MKYSLNGLKRSVVVGACLTAGAFGCSSPTIGPGSGTGPIPMESFTSAFVASACDLIFTCPVSDDEATLRLLFGDAQQCRTLAANLAGRQFDDLFAQVRAGSVRYDSAAARSCLDRLVSSCQINGSLATLCPEVFVGSIAASQPCWRSEECAGDAYCDHGSVTQTCPGSCRARVAAGQACPDAGSRGCSRAGMSGQAQCVFAPGATSGVCGEIRQGAPASEGQTCGTISTASGVETRVGCAQGLSCRTTTGTSPELTRTCQRVAAVGATCDRSAPCVAGAVCVPATMGAATGVCTSITVRNNAGETCVAEIGSAATGLLAVCNPYRRLGCVMGVCQIVGDGTVGASCSSGDLSEASCNAGLYCDSMTHQCAALRGTDAACESSSQCTSSTCISGRCAARTCN